MLRPDSFECDSQCCLLLLGNLRASISSQTPATCWPPRVCVKTKYTNTCHTLPKSPCCPVAQSAPKTTLGFPPRFLTKAPPHKALLLAKLCLDLSLSFLTAFVPLGHFLCHAFPPTDKHLPIPRVKGVFLLHLCSWTFRGREAFLLSQILQNRSRPLTQTLISTIFPL